VTVTSTAPGKPASMAHYQINIVVYPQAVPFMSMVQKQPTCAK
jgi:hypothetical protein